MTDHSRASFEEVAPGPARATVRNHRHKLGEDKGCPKYVFAEPRVGYRMAKGETAGPETGS